jgi:HSP20 family protein
MSVMRFDPFRDFERLTEQMLGGSRGSTPRSFPMDAYRRGDRSIDLTSEQNVLTISAERRFEQGEDDQVIVSERPQGTFSRQLFVSEALDMDAIEAHYDDGVLTLELPVAEQAKPRRIEISRGERGPRTIEGTASRTNAE